MSKTTRWSPTEQKIFKKLKTPMLIQEYLDSLAYNTDDKTRSPREVMLKRRAHCFDGALFAAAALEQLGFPPLLVDMRSNDQDDDHVIALFRVKGLYGAVAKSNYVGCRYREPVYRSVRELIMAYFNDYFNLAGQRTLREYSVPFDLRRVKGLAWRTTDKDLTPLGEQLDNTRHYWLLPRQVEKHLTRIDKRMFRAGTLGVNPQGAFKVKNSWL